MQRSEWRPQLKLEIGGLYRHLGHGGPLTLRSDLEEGKHSYAGSLRYDIFTVIDLQIMFNRCRIRVLTTGGTIGWCSFGVGTNEHAYFRHFFCEYP